MRPISGRQGLYKVVLLLASVLVSIGAGEAVLRFISLDQYFVWRPGLRNVFRPTPGTMPGIVGESRFSINENGLRGDPISGDHTYRILAIGGSTTECLFLDDREAWPFLLQEMLNASAGGSRRVWVGNAGRSGHTTRNHIVQVHRLSRQYSRIDAVLLMIGTNDLLHRLSLDDLYRPFPGLERLTANEYEALMDRSFAVRPGEDSQYPFFKRTEIWRNLRAVRNRYFGPVSPMAIQDNAGEIYKTWRMHRETASSIRTQLPDLTSALAEYSRNVGTIVEYAESRGIRVILVTQPSLWHAGLPTDQRKLLWMGGIGRYQEEPGHEYYSVEALAKGLARYNETLLEICGARNVECVDLAGRMARDTSNFYDDVHFNEGGSRTVARVLAEYFGRDRTRPAARPQSH